MVHLHRLRHPSGCLPFPRPAGPLHPRERGRRLVGPRTAGVPAAHLPFRGRHAGGTYLIEPPRPATGPRPHPPDRLRRLRRLAAPAYPPAIHAWVSAGGFYAIAQVRGGGEHGTAWHAAGSGVNKPACFTDFAAAARHLIDQGITTPSRLARKGASHSGLVVDVALTGDPHLYAAVVCSDAPTDMVRYPRFGLGPLWQPSSAPPTTPTT